MLDLTMCTYLEPALLLSCAYRAAVRDASAATPADAVEPEAGAALVGRRGEHIDQLDS
jgi:hypothetical protein